MRRMLREVRRAPARIVTTVFALALAIAAIGVFAIPTVSTSSLRDAAERDGLAEIVIGTTDTGDVAVVDRLAGLDGVDVVEPQIQTAVAPYDEWIMTVVGVRLDGQTIDVLRVDEGRLPAAPGEVLVTAGVAPVGAVVPVVADDGRRTTLRVVGIGGTSYWSGEDLAFTDLDTAGDLAGLDGVNRIVMTTGVSGADELRATASRARDELAAAGISTTYLPVTIPDGTHPIDDDIQQVSSLIGLLGIVAGIVALVLLGSTTNTLITERTREVAVMRALGAPNRLLRRRLRRLAVGIAVAAVVIGVPLGIVISNVIARMVLQEFVGLTPGIAVSVPVVVGSVLFALVGARLVSARAARRVTRRPLAEALRDRDGDPFGRRFAERAVARVPTGGLLARTAVRNGVHRRAGSMATLAQVTAAVAALMIITSLVTTVNEFNAAELEPWRYTSETWVAGPGLDIDGSIADADPRSEVSIEVEGEAEGWQIDVVGFEPETLMVDRALDDGVWPTGADGAIVSTGFAQRVGLDVGDRVEVLLASGTVDYEVTGLHTNHGRTFFVDLDGLAADLGSPGMANRVLSLDERPATVPDGLVSTFQLAAASEDQSGRNAILLIFGAIGLIVVSVAGLAVASGLAVNTYERRHEFAAMQAIGARRRHVLRVVSAELLPLVALGVAFGLGAGYLGAGATMASFEASNAVEIGFVFAVGAIPAAAAVAVFGSLFLGGLVVRRSPAGGRDAQGRGMSTDPTMPPPGARLTARRGMGRDDGSVTETTDSGRRDLPPPTGAPVGESGPGAGGPSKPFWADWDLPFDNPREAAEWWFGPLLDVRTWVALGYLLAGAILSGIWFAAVVVMLAVSLPLIIVVIGIPLTVLSFSAINSLAGVERRRAEWVGDPIPARPFAPRADSWWSRLITRLTDPTRWRQVAYFLASVVVAPALFALGALPLSIMVQTATSFDVPTPFGGLFNIGSLLLLVVMAGLVGRAAMFFAGIAHSYVEWFLGPDRTAELEARVDTLSEQRAEILEAVSAERRRIERNLHDGVQQQLVAIGIDIGRAQARIGDDDEAARLLLDEARDKVRGSVGELRMIGRGLHPAVLDDRGLDAALSSIVASSPIPIDVIVDVDDRIPIDVAETAYYVANEAVANLLKHASARVASIHVVEVHTPRPAISLSVHDDGRGGASMSAGGSGLAGMAARVRGVDGVFTVDSPPGGPTLVKAVIPLVGGGSDGR